VLTHGERATGAHSRGKSYWCSLTGKELLVLTHGERATGAHSRRKSYWCSRTEKELLVLTHRERATGAHSIEARWNPQPVWMLGQR